MCSVWMVCAEQSCAVVQPIQVLRLKCPGTLLLFACGVWCVLYVLSLDGVCSPAHPPND